jgi:geranylgeranyl reductase family protein
VNRKVAIVGAGPAGATCAYELARAGVEVILFDHKAPWEKPCGGMCSNRVFTEFDIMKDFSYPYKTFNEITLMSVRSDVIKRQLNNPIHTLSRKELGAHMLDKAIEAGVQFINEKVKKVTGHNQKWVVVTDNKHFETDFIIGADGVHSIVKKSIVEDNDRVYKSFTCGYYLQGVEKEECVFKFLNNLGYIWIYPRPNDCSIGIGHLHTFEKITAEKMFKQLDEFISDYFPGAVKKEKWSSFIPIVQYPDFFNELHEGKNWCLIGDASASVDSLTGEGIFYAMKSGVTAANDILNHGRLNVNRDKDFLVALIERSKDLQKLIKTAAETGPEVAGAFYYHMMCK